MNNIQMIDALAADATMNADKRRIEASVRLHDDAATGSDGVYLELSVSHNKDYKQFNIYAHLETRKTERGFQTSMWEPMNSRHNLRLPAVRADRYSQKALRDAWHHALETLRNAPETLDGLDLQWKSTMADADDAA